MGIKDITAENKCLLLKLLHRLHNPSDSAWARWVRERVDLATLTGDVAGPHWRDLAELLPLYHVVTSCVVGGGASTCFWEDRWLDCGRLKEVFPLLHSHAISSEVSVACVLRDGVRAHLMPRLTAGAREELAKLSPLLDDVLLSEEDDRRTSPLSGPENVLRAGPIYKMLMKTTGAPLCAFSTFVWQNRAPPRIQFFAWLLVQEKIQCKTNLLLKNIVDDARCELCNQGDETCDHIIFTCPAAADVWSALGVNTGGCSVARLWTVPCPATLPAKHSSVYILLVCWQLWKQRNNLVFNGVPPSISRFWSVCKEDAQLWCQRWPVADRVLADVWCSTFSSM